MKYIVSTLAALSLSGCVFHDPGRGGIEWDRGAEPRDYPLYDIED